MDCKDILNKKEKEEYIFEMEMGSSINLEEKIPILSIEGGCPRCGSRMQIFNNRCDCCGHVEFPIYSTIGIVDFGIEVAFPKNFEFDVRLKKAIEKAIKEDREIMKDIFSEDEDYCENDCIDCINFSLTRMVKEKKDSPIEEYYILGICLNKKGEFNIEDMGCNDFFKKKEKKWSFDKNGRKRNYKKLRQLFRRIS